MLHIVMVKRIELTLCSMEVSHFRGKSASDILTLIWGIMVYYWA